jgi:hypothetical protein
MLGNQLLLARKVAGLAGGLKILFQLRAADRKLRRAHHRAPSFQRIGAMDDNNTTDVRLSHSLAPINGAKTADKSRTGRGGLEPALGHIPGII